MNKSQLLLVVASIIVVVLLFVFGDRKIPPKVAASQQAPMAQGQQVNAAPPKIVNIDFEQLVTRLKSKLSKEKQDSIQLLENNLATATDKNSKIKVLGQLAKQWKQARYIEVASYFYKQIAQLDSTKTNWRQAGQELSQAFALSSDTTMRQFLLQNAIAAHQNTLLFDSTDIDTQIDLASCYIDGAGNQTKMVMDGVFMLRDVVAVDSLNGRANLILGRMAIVSGQFDKAVQRLQLVTQNNPANSEGYFYLGEAYLAQGNKEKAIEALKECKKLIKNPTFAAEIDTYINQILKSSN